MIFTARNMLKVFIQALCMQRLVFKFSAGKKCIYLTFDDGPDPVYTSRVLEILRDNNVKASFFLVGEKIDSHADIAMQIARSGHALAGHTYEHKVITEMTRQEIRTDLARTRACIKNTTNVDTVLFRPPRGKMNFVNILSAILHGYRVIHWSVTYSDYRKDSLERLVATMRNIKLRDGDILLLHDNNQYTVDALDGLIKSVKNQGYDLCALPQN